jgi:Fic family protein
MNGSMDWPSHRVQTVPWQQASRAGTKEDRIVREIDVLLPPKIAEEDIALDPDLAAQMEEVVREVTVLDQTHSDDLNSLTRMLLRSESVASSKIEEIEASAVDFAKALNGMKSNASAVSMVAATAALEGMVGSVAKERPITLTGITDAHRALMLDDPYEGRYAGKVRDVQNWIGGSDHSPRGALHIPPPCETVDEYLTDLIEFSNRTDVPVLAQAAIAHAQFESIHPFTDGNGRIGRALINTILRRRGTTTRVVVPLASALVAQRDRYFSLLGRYRDGEATPIIRSFVAGSLIAARESQTTAKRLAEIPAQWNEQVGRLRRGAATAQLLEQIAHHPVITVEEARRLVNAPTSSVYTAVERLAAAGILVPLTHRKRDQVWGAQAILNELDDLSLRIEMASRPPR